MIDMANRFLMCAPEYFQIEYEINPYMDMKNQVNQDAAISQWQKLVETIKACGGEVTLIDPVAGLPDMVFTANAGLVHNNQAVISKMSCRERQPESSHFADQLKKMGCDIVLDPTPYAFEGEAEAIEIGEQWFVASGFRSDEGFYQNHPFFKGKNLVSCELVDPYFYHLDTCFLYLGDNQVIWYPEAFSQTSRTEMQNAVDGLQFFDAPKNEASLFACNSVIIDKHIIMPAGCVKTAAHCESLGFEVHFVEMDQFLKAGGACNCMVLNLD